MTVNVVVLGCGLGGFAVSSRLSKQIGSRGTVTVVEPREKIPFPPTFPWLTFGSRKPEKVQKSLRSLQRRKNVRFVQEKAEKIDTSVRTVQTQSGEVAYDKLVVSLGAELALDQVPGLSEFSQVFYSLDGAMKLSKEIEVFPGGAIVVGICATPFKCPVAPYEMAFLIEENMRRRKRSAEISLFTPEPHPVPAAGSVIGKQVQRLLASRGVKYLPKTKPSRIEKDKVVFDDGSELRNDPLITVPPHRAPKMVVDSGLTGASGWVPVNPQNLATKFEDVYAIGDVAAIETPHGHVSFLPKAGVFAQGQAEVVADNLAASITGKGSFRQWDGTGNCHMQVSRSESAFLQGAFLSNPPHLEFHPPSRKWLLDKVKRERNWLAN